MANPALIRKALIKLMGAKQANQGAKPGPNVGSAIDLRMRRADADLAQGDDPLANPFRENQYINPERLRAHNRAIVGHPDADPNSTIRGLAGTTKEGRTRTGDLDTDYPDFDQARFPEPSFGDDPPPIPGARSEVPGSNEAITIFEQLMDQIAAGSDPDPRILQRLDQIHPPLAEIVVLEAKSSLKSQQGGPNLFFGNDEIPF